MVKTIEHNISFHSLRFKPWAIMHQYNPTSFQRFKSNIHVNVCVCPDANPLNPTIQKKYLFLIFKQVSIQVVSPEKRN